jgi:hypothetical protein
MKKLLFVFSVLALTLLMVGNVSAQSGVPIYNKAYVVFEHYGVISSTATDTTRWINICQPGSSPRQGAYDISWFMRSNDSLMFNLYYQLRNTDAGYTGAWTALDSCKVVDDAGAATDTTTIGVASKNYLSSTVIHGCNQIRFYFDYDGTTSKGTAASAAGDGVNNRFRFYIYFKPAHFGM